MYAINLEQYLETLESLPVEMRKKFFQMRDLDKKVVDNLRNVDELSENYLNNVVALTSNDKTEQLKNINKRFKKCKEMSDSKIQLAIQTYEMVDKYIRRLDAELAKFEAQLQHKAAIIMASSNSFNNSHISGQLSVSNERYAKSMKNVSRKDNTTVKRKLFETSLKRKYKEKSLYNNKKKKGPMKDRLNLKKMSHNISEEDDDEIPRINSKGNKLKKAKLEASKMVQKGMGDGTSPNISITGPGLLNLSSTSEDGISNSTALDGAGVVFPFSHPAQILDMPVDPNEPTYCICHQVSYGEMIGCDNPDCLIEWFHFGCVGLTHKPKGKWFCPSCSEDKHVAASSNPKHRKK